MHWSLFFAMIIIYIACVLVYQLIEAQKVPLKICEETESFKSKESEVSESSSDLNCFTQREEQANLMHQGLLFQFDYRQKVTIKCPICPGEDVSFFHWYFIPRGEAPLLESIRGQASLIRHFEKELTEDMFSGNSIPCLINRTNDLYIPNLNTNIHLGTYTCRYVIDRTHLSNRIWYHLDVMLPPNLFSDSLAALPAGLQSVQNVKSSKDVDSIMSEAGKLLQSSSQFTDYNSSAMDITSKLIPISSREQTCGDYTLTQYRRCYVVIPTMLEPAVRRSLSLEIQLCYEYLTTVFASFYTWMNAENMKVFKSQRSAAETMAAELGFELYYDGKPETKKSDLPEERDIDEEESSEPQNRHYYIPCHYTYFRHFSAEGIIPRPFSLRNLHVNISFSQPCPEVDYMEIINLALSHKDPKLLKMELLGYEEKRHMKLEKVAIDGTLNFEIPCGGEEQALDYNCSDPDNMTILWKQEGGVTFSSQPELGERVFVTPDCRLMFTKVSVIDEGVYSCYKRNIRIPNQWQTSAFASYRLKIEASSIKFPVAMDVGLGLILLTVWALILFLLWLLLSFWHFDVNRLAVIQARERLRRRAKEMRNKSCP